MKNDSKGSTAPEAVKMNRFVIRKTLVGKGVVISFTNKQGESYKYSHDEVFNTHRERFETMPCWSKYNGYTQTHRMPAFCRDLNLAASELRQLHPRSSSDGVHTNVITRGGGGASCPAGDCGSQTKHEY